MNTHTLDLQLRNFLQQDISFIVDNKRLREGRLMLFNIKDFYVSFMIKTKKDQTKIYEIPVPYSSKIKDGILNLDYSLPHAHRGNGRMIYLINALHNQVGKKSKFYDSIVTIVPNPA